MSWMIYDVAFEKNYKEVMNIFKIDFKDTFIWFWL